MYELWSSDGELVAVYGELRAAQFALCAALGCQLVRCRRTLSGEGELRDVPVYPEFRDEYEEMMAPTGVMGMCVTVSPTAILV